MSADQARSFTRHVADHPYGVALRDEGDGYLGLYFLTPEGEISASKVLPPVDP